LKGTPCQIKSIALPPYEAIRTTIKQISVYKFAVYPVQGLRFPKTIRFYSTYAFNNNGMIDAYKYLL